jgi:hypothetical protein
MRTLGTATSRKRVQAANTTTNEPFWAEVIWEDDVDASSGHNQLFGSRVVHQPHSVSERPSGVHNHLRLHREAFAG